MSTQNAEHIILDSSALITILAEEKGQEVIIPLLPKAIMSSVNIAEVAKFLIESKGFSKNEVSTIVHSLIEKIIAFDTQLALISAEIIHITKRFGLSLGDRACLALAMQLNYPIYTADKIWSKLDLDCKVILIR
jgi:PIN domain nuclease of toxin-antitoxin system